MMTKTAACIAALFTALPAFGSDLPSLADRHGSRSVPCGACHASGETAPAGEDACIRCHGDMDKMGEKSEGRFSVNPHAPHGARVSCLACHRGHAAPVNYCNKCHDFDFVVR